MHRHLPRDKRASRLHALSMRWVLMLFVILAAVMGGGARAVVVMGRAVVMERVVDAAVVERVEEDLRGASRGVTPEVEEAAGLADAGPLACWFPGGLAVARSDCDAAPDEALEWDGENRLTGMWRGPWKEELAQVPFASLVGEAVAGSVVWRWGYDHRSRRVQRDEPGSGGERRRTVTVFSGGTSAAEYTETAAAAAGSAWTVPPAATVQHVRGPDLGGGTKGLLYSLRNGLPRFNRYNGRGDVVAQSDIDGTTTWAASYQADGRRTAEAGTNVERHRANTKEEDPTGLLNEGFRYRDMETGTFISRDPLGLVDGPNVYCYVGQNPWTKIDPEGLFWGAIIGGGVDLFMQTVVEGRSLSEVNYARVGASAALGLVTGGVSAFAAKGMAAAGTSMAGRMAMNATIGANVGVAQNALINADYGRPLEENADRAAAFGAAGGALFEPAMLGMGAVDDAIAAAMSKGGKPPPTFPGGPSAQMAGEIAAAETNAQLKPGDVLKYRDYLAGRQKGSSLRGHHIPQSKRLEEVGIDKLEGTVVVMEGAEHVPTRTFAGRGSKTAAAERGTPLSDSESLDLADPTVQRLGAGVAEKVRKMNRENHPDHFSN
jgi:RHS repeat-associated protein